MLVPKPELMSEPALELKQESMPMPVPEPEPMPEPALELEQEP